MSRLTVKQRKFADYFIETGNATESAKRAGYSKKTARFIGAENLTKPNVKKYIDERMAELAEKRVAKQEEILETLTKILRGEEEGTALVGVGMGEQAIEQVKPTLQEKIKAAELLGKRYAMWTDKQQVENITPIFVEDVPEDDD